MINLKKYLNQKTVSIGSWITIGDSSVVEIMARKGFDWLTIDMEHSAITIDIAQRLIRIIDLCGVVPLVRVCENDATVIKCVMDAGARGVIVPMVNSKEDAFKAVNAVKYPPQGTRGVGLARAQDYGLGFQEYKQWVEKDSVVIVQIEHIDAVTNLAEILQVPDVDGFIVGPYDLSASLGKPGNFKDKEFLQALQTIKRVSGQLHKASGFHVIPPDAQEVRKRIKEGYTFVGFSLDSLFLGTKCRDEMQQLKG